MSEARFPTLDLLRGIAAVIVVMEHTQVFLEIRINGGLCVDLFFCLSGFVLGYAYDRRLDAGLTGSEFMRARLIRFFPLYLLGTGIALLTAKDADALTVVAGLLMLPFLPGPMYALNPPAWSLFFELVANVVYAYAKPVRLWPIVLGMAPALIYGAITFDSLTQGAVLLCLPRATFSFFAGLMLWRFFAKREHKPLPAWTALALAVALVAIIAIKLPGWCQGAFDLAMMTAVFPAMIFLGARTRLTGLASAIADTLGLASYPMYATHWPLAVMMAPTLGFTPWRWWLAIPLLIVVSIALERFVHQPMKDLLTNRPLRAVAAQATA